MTDRHAGYVVVLATDMRDDDAEAVLTALRMVKGVASVEPVVADIALHIAEARANQKWVRRLMDFVDDVRQQEWGPK